MLEIIDADEPNILFFGFAFVLFRFFLLLATWILMVRNVILFIIFALVVFLLIFLAIDQLMLFYDDGEVVRQVEYSILITVTYQRWTRTFILVCL